VQQGLDRQVTTDQGATGPSVCWPPVAEDDAPLDLDRVIAEIAATVEERTRAGEYPADLEDRLRSHVVSLERVGDGSADAVIAEVERLAAPAPSSSRGPVADALHRIVGDRQPPGRALTGSTDELATAIVAALRALADDARGARAETDVVQQRLADVERAVRHARGLVDSLVDAQQQLAARIERLERDGSAGR
jgi:hypothetical protein